jgi:hypothetical protein
VTTVMDDSCVSTTARIGFTVTNFHLKSRPMKGKKTAKKCFAAEGVPV